MKRLAILAAVALGAGATAADSRDHSSDLDRALAGRVAGTPVDCIEQSRVDGPEIIGNHTLIYRQTGRRLWRNELADACPGLDPDTVLIVQVYGGRLCRNDRFKTLQRGTTIPGPICRLGRFTPYDKPGK